MLYVAATLGTNKPLDSDKAGQEARKTAEDKAAALQKRTARKHGFASRGLRLIRFREQREEV